MTQAKVVTLTQQKRRRLDQTMSVTHHVSQQQVFHARFDSLLYAYPFVLKSGLKEEGIDTELIELKNRMEKFRTSNRVETPVDQTLQREIEGLECLVKLHKRMYVRRDDGAVRAGLLENRSCRPTDPPRPIHIFKLIRLITKISIIHF